MTADAPPQQNPLVKLALEIGPLVVFFIANARYDIFTATAAFMAAVTVALAISYVKYRHIPVMPLVSGFFVLVFGALTLILNDELFIKLKPTVVNLLFATILFGGLFFGKALLAPLLESAIQLTERGWKRLTLEWACFFVFLAILNEVVWRNFTTDTWVDFKVFGIMPITLVFSGIALYSVRKEMIQDKSGQ